MSCEKEIRYTGDMIDYLGELSQRHDPNLEGVLGDLAEVLKKGKQIENQIGENVLVPEIPKLDQ